jgi:5-methylcytosine-specific restriction endonuclease McrA
MTARERSYDWKKRVARERRRLTRDPSAAVCWLCGDPIDMDLPHDHDRAFSLDHVVPVGRGGDEARGEARPAHRACISARGDGHRGPQPATLLDW